MGLQTINARLRRPLIVVVACTHLQLLLKHPKPRRSRNLLFPKAEWNASDISLELGLSLPAYASLPPILLSWSEGANSNICRCFFCLSVCFSAQCLSAGSYGVISIYNL